MLIRFSFPLAILLVFGISAHSQDKDESRDEAARKDLQRLQGTWQLQTHENADTEAAKVDPKKRTLFVGGELFLVKEGTKIVQIGVLRLTTARTPRRADVVVKKGEHADNTMLGVYEIKGDTVKFCFDPEGEGRPAKLTPQADTKQFSVSYKRIKAADEKIEIVGKYKSLSEGSDGKTHTMLAEISRRGEAYVVRWLTDEGNLAYVGTGIRQGDTLSVAWVNRGSLGLSVYKIEKGPKLTGVFTDVGGPGILPTETLTSVDRDWAEVRAR
jgi:uncharacterized protein (TIGR03067 family)